MEAYILTGLNSADYLIRSNEPVPDLRPGEVLIRTKSIDINPVDSKTLQGKGQYSNIKTDLPVILGWGLSGTVEVCAADVTSLVPGDEVFGLVNFPGHGRAYATYVAAPAEQLAVKPRNIDFPTAAGLTLSALMALQALEKAAIKPGERVLIQGIAGGVGFPALQIAKSLGAYVIGTALPSDIARMKSFGADELVDFTTTDFSKVLSDVDFVLDTLGGESLIKAFDILSAKGRIITIPSNAGDEWKTIAAERGIKADFLFVHSSGEDMKQIARLAGEGKLVPNIAHQFDFGEIPKIHELMLDRKINGKIVVNVVD